MAVKVTKPAMPAIVGAVVAGAFTLSSPPAAAVPLDSCVGATSETIYVPMFSRVHTHERRSLPLASTLVIHNIDPSVTIAVTVTRRYDEAGNLVEDLLSERTELTPFGSINFLTEINDSRGGIGANYIVEWTSEEGACSPIALTVMIGGTGTQGISFALEGRVIARQVSAAD